MGQSLGDKNRAPGSDDRLECGGQMPIGRYWIGVGTLAFLVMAASAVGGAQGSPSEDHVRKARVELSASASFARVRIAETGESVTDLNVPLRAGFLITDRLELEGEMLFTHEGGEYDSETGALFQANGLYHFASRGRVAPFVLLGGGRGNAVEFLTLARDAGTSVTAVNLGAGLKVFLGDHGGLRIEYRFTRLSGDILFEVKDAGFEERDIGASYHKLLVGVSVWLR